MATTISGQTAEIHFRLAESTHDRRNSMPRCPRTVSPAQTHFQDPSTTQTTSQYESVRQSCEIVASTRGLCCGRTSAVAEVKESWPIRFARDSPLRFTVWVSYDSTLPSSGKRRSAGCRTDLQYSCRWVCQHTGHPRYTAADSLPVSRSANHNNSVIPEPEY